MTVSADEINFLIRRHLQEAGYPHTAFIFSQECMLDQSNIQVSQLPPQALITILKKGMLYMQLEKGINEKARTEDPTTPENIVLSLLETVRRDEPIIPAKANTRPKNPVPTPLTRPSQSQLQTVQLQSNAALFLKGHFADVYCGAWTQDGKYLATGSGDATAIIWEIRDHKYYQHYILDHATQQERNGKDIATLAWSPVSEGGTKYLATGCYDGSARIWTNKGELKFVLVSHTDPVFTVQFSPDGQLLLTGSADRKVIAWNVNTGDMRQTFQCHRSRCLDVDWLDNESFASCSGDSTIAICQIGRPKPIMILEGHKGEVNKIEWDPSHRMLASCSDDKTVRVWRPFDRSAQPIILQGHQNQVYTIKWAPGDEKLLASGAFDFTVRLWDVANQQCRFVLTNHTQPIYTICFSPRGRFFVSGGIDNVLNMWRTQDAVRVASYQAKSGIFEAQWDPTGENIAMCLSDATVAILPTNEIIFYRE